MQAAPQGTDGTSGGLPSMVSLKTLDDALRQCQRPAVTPDAARPSKQEADDVRRERMTFSCHPMTRLAGTVGTFTSSELGECVNRAGPTWALTYDRRSRLGRQRANPARQLVPP